MKTALCDYPWRRFADLVYGFQPLDPYEDFTSQTGGSIFSTVMLANLTVFLFGPLETCQLIRTTLNSPLLLLNYYMLHIVFSFLRIISVNFLVLAVPFPKCKPS